MHFLSPFAPRFQSLSVYALRLFGSPHCAQVDFSSLFAAAATTPACNAVSGSLSSLVVVIWMNHDIGEPSALSSMPGILRFCFESDRGDEFYLKPTMNSEGEDFPRFVRQKNLQLDPTCCGTGIGQPGREDTLGRVIEYRARACARTRSPPV